MCLKVPEIKQFSAVAIEDGHVSATQLTDQTLRVLRNVCATN